MKALDTLRNLYNNAMDAPRFSNDAYADSPTDSRLEAFIAAKEQRLKRAMSTAAFYDTISFENPTV